MELKKADNWRHAHQNMQDWVCKYMQNKCKKLEMRAQLKVNKYMQKKCAKKQWIEEKKQQKDKNPTHLHIVESESHGDDCVHADLKWDSV